MLFETALSFRQVWQGTHEDMVSFLGKAGFINKQCQSDLGPVASLQSAFADYSNTLWGMGCYVNLNQTYHLFTNVYKFLHQRKYTVKLQ